MAEAARRPERLRVDASTSRTLIRGSAPPSMPDRLAVDAARALVAERRDEEGDLLGGRSAGAAGSAATSSSPRRRRRTDAGLAPTIRSTDWSVIGVST